MDLTVFLEPKVDLPRITKVLDELGHLGRLATIRAWDEGTMRALWAATKAKRPLDLDHFVPRSMGELVEVIHHGKNSLAAFNHFQKRFCRPPVSANAGAVLSGYNEQEMAFWTGPGYFVTRAEADGEVHIDYRSVPKDKPESWPEILPNEARLGRFVYAGMVDVMRGISKHVSIGRARREGKWLNAWFVLCREDVS
jgi:hypothetical protein